jgi:hypothetical protein
MSDSQDAQKTGTDPVVASEASTTPKRMNPDDMHDLFEGVPGLNGSDEDDPFAQMRSDPNYAALIKDLEEIAKVARELFANSDEASPSDDLWKKIEQQLPEKPDEV